MAILNKVGRPKKVKTAQVKFTYSEVRTLIRMIEARHDQLIYDGYENEWGHFAHDVAEEMGRVYTLGAKLLEVRDKMKDA